MLCEAGVMKEHRLPSLCAQRSFTPLPCSLKNSGENPRWGAQATGLCSADTIKPYLITTSHRLEALCVLVSNLAPDNVFVISPVNKSVDFSVLIVTK
jgi:hypothetical protein